MFNNALMYMCGMIGRYMRWCSLMRTMLRRLFHFGKWRRMKIYVKVMHASCSGRIVKDMVQH